MHQKCSNPNCPYHRTCEHGFAWPTPYPYITWTSPNTIPVMGESDFGYLQQGQITIDTETAEKQMREMCGLKEIITKE